MDPTEQLINLPGVTHVRHIIDSRTTRVPENSLGIDRNERNLMREKNSFAISTGKKRRSEGVFPYLCSCKTVVHLDRIGEFPEISSIVHRSWRKPSGHRLHRALRFGFHL